MKSWKKARLAQIVAGASVALVPMLSHAALDAAVTTAITAAQTDLTSLYGALTTAGAALFVLRIIYKRFFKIG